MWVILAFLNLCKGSLLIGQTINSPYKQLNLLNGEVEVLKEVSENYKTKIDILEEEICNLKETITKNNEIFKTNYEELSKKISTLEAENKTLKESAQTDNSLQELNLLKTSYNNLEQEIKKNCQFESNIELEKYNLIQKEIQEIKDFSLQLEQKILNILADWCKQAEYKIDIEHQALEKFKNDFQNSNNLISYDAFLKFKNENEQHVRELIDFFAEEKIAQFAQKLDNQEQKIQQISKKHENNVTLKQSFQKIEKRLGEFCKETCDETIRQVNDRLQNLAQQMQSGFDALSCAKCTQHTIISGESLSSIAKKYNTTPAQIRAVNGLQNAKSLRVGDVILIPKNQ